MDQVAWLAESLPDPALPTPESTAAELRQRAGAIVGELDGLDPETRAWTVARLRAHWLNGNYAEGREWATRCLEEAEISPAARSRVLELAASTSFEQGDEADARRLFSDAVDVAPDDLGRAISLGGLARCELMAGDTDAARRAARACEEIHRTLGDEVARMFPLHVLAYSYYIDGDDHRARAGFQVTLGMARERGIRWREAQELTNLCSVETRAGNLDEAAELGLASLSIARELGQEYLLPYCVINLAALASATGDHERAAFLLGGGDALLEAAGAVLNPGTAIEYRRHRAATEQALGDAAFTRAYEAGRSAGREAVFERAATDEPRGER